eukprot:TRINITY_DN2931_c1_g1_i1.p2 TRINITY_DN2931_c1_g1~~TRINITY_DN2931_c1_g1_i1.p2  ORF type:complete len:397 (-),score=82.40 TRINITY_DN2931_c1_g1_i1:109-1299(-)
MHLPNLREWSTATFSRRRTTLSFSQTTFTAQTLPPVRVRATRSSAAAELHHTPQTGADMLKLVSNFVQEKQHSFQFHQLSGSCLDANEMSKVLDKIFEMCTNSGKSTQIPGVNLSLPAPKEPPKPRKLECKETKRLKLQAGCFSEQGKRPQMEDASVIIPEVSGLPFKESTAYYAIFDGHSGADCAKLMADSLHKDLFADPYFHVFDFEPAFTQTFARMDEVAIKNIEKSGSTAVVAVVVGKTLCVANLGDSECILCRREGKENKVEVLSQKHVPTSEDESQRITKLGGAVVFGRVFGVLAVSRAFGDKSYKLKQPFVSCEPHVAVRPLTRKDSFLLIACDGLWERWKYQEAVDFIAAHRELGRKPEDIAAALGMESIKRGSSDNVTAIIVFFTWK